ncbi:glycosyltransferase family 1 protein, partial [Atractiella rhizophila]
TLAVFLGSGGHTAEMFRLIAPLSEDIYTKRKYLVSAGDIISLSKIQQFERERQSLPGLQYSVFVIPRARRVHQSFFTAPFTTSWSLAHCLFVVAIQPILSGERAFADVVLLNGPGSCVPIAIAAHLPRLFLYRSPKVVYIESIARITSLSLSAKILRSLNLVDELWVQWDELATKLNQKSRKNKVLCDGWLI